MANLPGDTDEEKTKNFQKRVWKYTTTDSDAD